MPTKVRKKIPAPFIAAATGALALNASPLLTNSANAQLQPDQVLVVYDSRKPIQIEIAQHYAGSNQIPQSTAQTPAARPGVHVFDLATAARPELTGSELLPSQFITDLRDPIRDHIESQRLQDLIRCIVLLKGTPHRILDFDDPQTALNPNVQRPIGDMPSTLAQERNVGDASCAAVDSELALLWQDLQDDEAGATLDSRADGPIKNPYAGQTKSINRFPTTYRQTQKSLAATNGISTLINNPNAPDNQQLTPGDLLLVCRLDANTLAGVLAMIDRSQSIYIDPATNAIILDESGSDGFVSLPGNLEFDNAGGALGFGDDYELARDLALIDGRFDPTLVYYNALGGQNQFFVGPNTSATTGITVPEPVTLIASYARNHGGGDGASRAPEGSTFITRYNLSQAAIANTFESYNARPLNGLGKFFDQISIAEFIEAGGNFAIGNVYEPLSDTAADNAPLVRNFILGNLTWAEAAYSALPALSWMQVVIGDPLARVQRATEDLNNDGKVDTNDLYAWPSNPRDINNDGVADTEDRTIIYEAITPGDRARSRSNQRPRGMSLPAIYTPTPTTNSQHRQPQKNNGS